MGIISLLFSDPLAFLLLTIALLYSVIAHETAHGWAAYLFGDDTAKRAGRLSANPLAHIDPLGAAALLVVGFGWAKPVPVDYGRIKNGKAGVISVALAGCAANIVFAALAVFCLKKGAGHFNQMTVSALVAFARINLILGSFNLLPIPPLDGARAVMSIMPRKMAMGYSRMEPYGIPVLLFLIFTGLAAPAITFIQRGMFLLIRIVTGL